VLCRIKKRIWTVVGHSYNGRCGEFGDCFCLASFFFSLYLLRHHDFILSFRYSPTCSPPTLESFPFPYVESDIEGRQGRSPWAGSHLVASSGRRHTKYEKATTMKQLVFVIESSREQRQRQRQRQRLWSRSRAGHWSGSWESGGGEIWGRAGPGDG
jgi:hypothetical protein